MITVINRSYQSIEFPTSKGQILINGANLSAIQLLNNVDRYGKTLVEDEVWEEIKAKFSHVLSQGFIYADKQEKSAIAKYNERSKEVMPSDPVDINKTANITLEK